MLREQTSFVLRVVPGGGGPAEIGKALANIRPEIPVGGPRHGCSLCTAQLPVPIANDSGRRSPLSITSPATVGASAGWNTSSWSPGTMVRGPSR